MRTTSASACASASRSSIASAVGVSTTLDAVRRRDGEVRREQRHVGAAPARLLGERDAHAPRGAVADEADRVERLARAAGRDEHALAGERSGAGEQLLGRGGRSPPARTSARRRARPRPVSPSSGPISSTPRSRSVSDVRLRRRVRPHAVVHRRRDEHGPAMRERGLGEDVVGDPLRELGERVRGAGRDDEQVGARRGADRGPRRAAAARARRTSSP